MSRYNPAHAHLFGGVQAPAAQRAGALRRSCIVELVRHKDVKARFLLDHAAQLELHPKVGERLECEQSWGEGDFSTIAVEVVAVHPGGFVDVVGMVIDETDRPAKVTLRRYPEERSRLMASEAAEKIESARRVYAAALGTKDEAAAKLELEKLVAESKRASAKAVR